MEANSNNFHFLRMHYHMAKMKTYVALLNA